VSGTKRGVRFRICGVCEEGVSIAVGSKSNAQTHMVDDRPCLCGFQRFFLDVESVESRMLVAASWSHVRSSDRVSAVPHVKRPPEIRCSAIVKFVNNKSHSKSSSITITADDINHKGISIQPFAHFIALPAIMVLFDEDPVTVRLFPRKHTATTN